MENTEALNLIVGTAGHVDHGKSSLVQALTGTNPDRLPEEQRREITIRLGFAFLETPRGELGIVDVPGHEKLVREMVAGATGFDAVLLVIAADEGLMPQTREHLDILGLLGINRGLVALTKVDLVEEEWLALVEEEVRETLSKTAFSGAPILHTSTKTGAGIDELRDSLFELAAGTRRETLVGRPFRLWADRSFTVRGFGSVATGTVQGGGITVGDSVELFPGGGKARVRGLQTNGRSRDSVGIGQRVAINLAGLPKRGLKHGDLIATPNSLVESRRFDARLRLLPSSKPLARITHLNLHLGTREERCRVMLLGRERLLPGEETFAQIEPERPLSTCFNDNFLLRFPSPAITVAGGRVLDPLAQHHRRSRKSYLAALDELNATDAEGSLPLWLKHNPLPGKELTTTELARRSGLLSEVVVPTLQKAVEAGEVAHLGGERWLHSRWHNAEIDKLRRGLAKLLEKKLPFHHLNRGELAQLCGGKTVGAALLTAIEQLLSEGLLRKIGAEYAVLPQGELSNKQRGQIESARRLLAMEDPLGLYKLAEAERLHADTTMNIARYLEGIGEAAFLDDAWLWSQELYESFRQLALEIIQRDGELRVAEFKEATKLSRKFATQLLDHFYNCGMTDRNKGTHVLLDTDKGGLSSNDA